MLELVFSPTYRESYRKLPLHVRKKVKAKTRHIQESPHVLPAGFKHKMYKSKSVIDYFGGKVHEVYADKDHRLFYLLEPNTVVLLLAGNRQSVHGLLERLVGG